MMIIESHDTMEEVAAIFLLRDDGAALMQHRDNKPGLRHAGMWVPPGGHCEPGEAIEACARRELREETGYDCTQLSRLLSFIDYPTASWPTQRLTIFWSRYDGVQAVRCLEGQAMRFIERDMAQEYSIPAYIIEIWDRALAAAAGRPRN
jgi:8-oxo-dGTP pyrophosphatase MutT (NUDIX family)